MLKSQIMAADYRRRATESLEAASESALAQVRDKLKSAAQAWILLAEMEDRRVLHAREIAQRAANAAQVAGAAAGCP